MFHGLFVSRRKRHLQRQDILLRERAQNGDQRRFIRTETLNRSHHRLRLEIQSIAQQRHHEILQVPVRLLLHVRLQIPVPHHVVRFHDHALNVIHPQHPSRVRKHRHVQHDPLQNLSRILARDCVRQLPRRASVSILRARSEVRPHRRFRRARAYYSSRVARRFVSHRVIARFRAHFERTSRSIHSSIHPSSHPSIHRSNARRGRRVIASRFRRRDRRARRTPHGDRSIGRVAKCARVVDRARPMATASRAV